MSTTRTPSTPAESSALPAGPRKAYLSIVGLAAVVILFQAVWAGLFIQEGQEYTHRWVEVHARGADVAIGLAVIAAVVAFVKLRARADLWIGAAAVAVILVVEAYIGGVVGAHPGITVVHLPLGMALMALAVYLPMRAARS